MNIKIKRMLAKLEADVMARGVENVPEDPKSMALFVVKLHAKQAKPDWDYINGVLCASTGRKFLRL